jgi:hypothetical protein
MLSEHTDWRQHNQSLNNLGSDVRKLSFIAKWTSGSSLKEHTHDSNGEGMLISGSVITYKRSVS